jgi:hypothetical protein
MTDIIALGGVLIVSVLYILAILKMKKNIENGNEI